MGNPTMSPNQTIKFNYIQMKKHYLFLSLLVGVGFANFTFQDNSFQDNYASSAEDTYKTYCASCHGDHVQAFVDRKWKHGTSKAELVNSITKGYPDNGMPTWGEVLTPKQIEDLADLIVKSIAEGSRYEFNSKPTSPIFSSEGATVKLDTIAKDMDNPWGMAFLPNGDILVTDRKGELYRILPSKQKQIIGGVPAVFAKGQGGLSDIILHPQFTQNQWVYISYSKQGKEENFSTTAIVRATLVGNQLTEQKEIFEALPYSKTQYHYGTRMAFDKQGYLYVTVGDRGMQKENPQSLQSDCGKIHRLKDDGSVPTDNPFVKSGRPTIYSWGHRNPQGLIVHPVTGDILAHEHGPRGGDELNLIQKGKNYGWPVISYGINYDGTTFTNITAKEGMEQPQHYWIPSIAPSGMAYIDSKHYPTWQGNIMIGSLRFKYLNRCIMNGTKIVKQENILKNIGRLRNVKVSPDGYIYVSVEEPGYVFKLIPQ
jgi:aldose sugar dehydrogenase